MGLYNKEEKIMIMSMRLQKARREILDELRKISTLSIGANQLIYLVQNPQTKQIEYTITGGAPYKWGIATALKKYDMYDIINALFSDDLGYSITVNKSRDYDSALCIRMSARDDD